MRSWLLRTSCFARDRLLFLEGRLYRTLHKGMSIFLSKQFMSKDLGPIQIRSMQASDLPGVVRLQRDCFPPPFPEDHLWNEDHLRNHLQLFPEGQFVATHEGSVIGSSSSARVSEDVWNRRLSWEETLGGFYLQGHDPSGTTLYGADISVHPGFRGAGVGRSLYHARFSLVRALGMKRYGTACRLPGCRASGLLPHDYVAAVCLGKAQDRTLTPLLRYGLTVLAILEDYMHDEESNNAAALLEWKP